ncbi:ParA family protein [Thioalkalivibrio sp. XN8]|uniref:ParA family protein n=1 Tax=Thioalkalivibrio sp. XN8 TaxID=2712863 RepID=UPI0013EDB750|nr:ParA family protein [Thioalkalivibrio sp. XN8]NGP52871.1 ParA family protein [Thioalkalivibrio sp. XN8]
MRHILVMNPKGGCGKSTVATNLASWYATRGRPVALADFDPQRSSLDWAGLRPADAPPITAVAGFEDGLRGVPRSADVVVIDAPARAHGRELNELVRRAETVLVPVLPSAIDMRAAANFITELLEVGRVARQQAKIAVIANRIKEHTVSFDELDAFLRKLGVPYVATLRDAQNYVRAYARGLGVFELPPYLAWQDWEQWAPLTDWLDSAASRP